jgi:hypothetical protein
MSYDTRCYELAKDFLSDELTLGSAAHLEELAQEIQDTIEAKIQELKERSA